MKFITSISKKDYDKFVLNTKNPHFLQSYAWGEFSAVSKNYIAHYVGLEKNKKIVAVALLLEKKLPMGFSYFYSPRGFVIDYDDYDLLSTFIVKLKEYCKKHKAIFIKIDPEIVINVNEETFNSENKINNIKKVGFKHKGYTKEFKRSFQPRYTFQIDLTKEWEQIFKSFSKSTRERIRKSNNVEFIVGTKKDLKEFYKLIYMTELRKGFISYKEDYYEKLFDVYYKDKIKLFLGRFNISNQIKEIEEQINDLDKVFGKTYKKELKIKYNNQKEELLEDLNKYKDLKNTYGDTIILNAYFTIIFGDNCWLLYAGNHNILSETNSTFKVYSEFLKYFKELGLKICDQFGSPSSKKKDSSVYGLYEFKKRFGGDFVEFIGEFDLILNKFMYIIFDKIVPIYRYLVKKLRIIKKGD